MEAREWVEAQWRLTAAHQAGRAGGERRPVKVRWWTTRSRRSDEVRGALFGNLWSSSRRRRLTADGVQVALYPLDAPVGTRPFLTFEAEAGTFASASGRATAVVIGDPEPGGALVVETRHGAVYPRWIPEGPAEATPCWSEVDG